MEDLFEKGASSQLGQGAGSANVATLSSTPIYPRARSVAMHLNPDEHSLGTWMNKLEFLGIVLRLLLRTPAAAYL